MRGTCEKMTQKESLVLYLLLLGLFQDSTTASWMLVFLFSCTFYSLKSKTEAFPI